MKKLRKLYPSGEFTTANIKKAIIDLFSLVNIPWNYRYSFLVEPNLEVMQEP